MARPDAQVFDALDDLDNRARAMAIPLYDLLQTLLNLWPDVADMPHPLLEPMATAVEALYAVLEHPMFEALQAAVNGNGKNGNGKAH